ncbi:MAG: LysE family translocator [Actinomycetota bacterium]|nr:LysE family translocator [Actinomycetota bacterium]
MVSLLQILPAFIATAFLLALVPGQTVAMILRQAIVGGSKTAYTTLIGTSSALIIWGAASAVGLSQIFARSQSAYNLLKFAGVGFLTFLALQTLWSLRQEFGKFDYQGEVTTGFISAFRLGLITNLTNAKAAVFAVAFIPAFVPADFNLGWGIFLLSIVQAMTSASWYSFLVHMIGRATTTLARPKVRRALTAFSALGILFLAVTLLIASPR